MKKLITAVAALMVCLGAKAQETDSFFKHMYLPVDFGASLCTTDGIGGAFYMRACLEYRFNVAKGPFIAAEFDTRTHAYSKGSIVLGNAAAGDAAYTDLLVGPGWRFSCSDSFKIALSLQGGASNLAMKEVAEASAAGKYALKPLERWYASAKTNLMLEYYLNPAFDLYASASLTATQYPNVTFGGMDPIGLFPTFCLGFSMALE
ncbi:MAG: hypothetical protein IKX67_04410 [Bacteroidales bacterium]|nr:hypothetical protein [Bacteroidales bacterium]